MYADLREDLTLSEEIERAARLIDGAGTVVALTGAGISTESGIPDFRSAGGLWTRYDPMACATFESFVNDPTKFWEMASELNPMLETAEPNPAHLALFELEGSGKCEAVITQNIDNLHQRAGTTDVLELHGTYRTGTCLSCGANYTYEEIKECALREGIPVCKECKGVIKPDIILFGEPLNASVLQRTVELAERCDLMLVIGCGLDVFPAASLPECVHRNRAHLIFVNVAPTARDDLADVTILEQAGVAMPRIVETYRRLLGKE
ncbi:MAG: NAD-dependent protein deacylase [Candidatus Anoxymicrobium japonicum]|uniref:protein acetyllysine N-acetyltransferase n=1 Tax=Candidatus Anoxymicrobium japonicum TaxID=2013648 RepID=A0A2N3G546_9ACTN|nr:MAG: NAD-dependent protein deacylase [Candidatus Anoxymicrobium japonicum]